MILLKKIVKFLCVAFVISGILSCDTSSSDAAQPNNVCAVAYQSEHGTAPAPITVNFGSLLTNQQLPELTAPGYTFDGWYDGNFRVASYGYIVHKNVMLTARWNKIPVKYTVTYKTDYGTQPNSFNILEDSYFSYSQLPELSASGYIFEGWYDGDKKVLANDYKVTKNVTLTAKWKKSETSNDNKNPSDKTDADKASTDKTDADKTNNDKIKTEESKKFYVNYYNAMGTAPSSFYAEENTVLTSAQLPVLSNSNNIFDGWYDGDTKAVAGEYKVTKSVQLKAKWRAKPYVSYYTNYGTPPSSFYAEENTVLTSEQLPELEYDGYIFEGWYDGDTKAVAGEYKVTKNVRLTAKWIQNSSITVQIPENTDISLTAQKNGSGSAWTLTAESGFTNYSWRVDGKVQSETSNILILNVSDWTRGYYEVSVEAQKDSEYYSARANITVGGN